MYEWLYKRSQSNFSISQLWVLWITPAICVSTWFDKTWMKVPVTILALVTGASVTRTRWNHTRVLIWNVSFWFVPRYNILPSISIFCVGETCRECWFPDLLSEVMARFAKRSITRTIPPFIFSIKHILC